MDFKHPDFVENCRGTQPVLSIDSEPHEVLSDYDSIAGEYAQQFDGDNRDVLFVDNFLRLLPPNAEVVDIGSGTGKWAKYFSEKGHKVIATDISHEMLRISKTARPDIPVVQADMRHLPFSREMCDAATLLYSLFHLTKQEAEKVLRQLHDIVRENGYIFLALQEGEGEEMIHRNYDGKEVDFFAKYYTKEEIEALLELTGFHLERYEIRPFDSNTEEIPHNKLFITAKK